MGVTPCRVEHWFITAAVVTPRSNFECIVAIIEVATAD